ncbi:hypothetical protein QP179_09940 [Sphingomonas aurantiaca]|uniref:hypothetical protein n=1 Tax=Sphingomonas aurantiaca TaxID=185949 RepID=UPI002FE20EDC
MIIIHGRGSLSAEIKTPDQDLSERTVYFELPAANIRKLLPNDASDPTAKRLRLSRAEINSLPITSTEYPIFEYAILDETDPLYPDRISEGSIQITGYRSE